MDRKADPEAQVMIDEAILDYLLYTAIKALLQETRSLPATENHAHLPLQMVDCGNTNYRNIRQLMANIAIAFLSLFRALHPDHQAPTQVRFRLRLLQFTYMFTRWERHPSARLSPPTTESRNLQKTLPMFLALSAVQNAIQESTITELWMRLAAGYMAQAYAEQVLSCPDNRPGLLEEMFHWHFDPDCSASEGSDEWLINRMFDAEHQVVKLWADIKGEHMRAVSQSLGTRYLMISTDSSIYASSAHQNGLR